MAKTRKSLMVLGVAFLTFWTYTLAAQFVDPCDGKYPCNSPRIVSFAEELHGAGIDTSPASLLAALHNIDPRVRSLAAHQLVAERDLGAIPAIENALFVETDNLARVNIASALTSIGDPVGAKHLEAVCSDTSLPLVIVIRAEQSLAIARGSHPELASTGKCLAVILDALDRSSERDNWLGLLYLLPSMYRDAPKEQADRMVSDAQNLLSDVDPSRRMAASHALAEMESAQSAPLIRNALSLENDPVIRSSLQRDLTQLEKTQ